MGQVVDEAVPASDEVHLPHDVPHLQPAQRLRDEVLAPERHLGVLIALDIMRSISAEFMGLSRYWRLLLTLSMSELQT